MRRRRRVLRAALAAVLTAGALSAPAASAKEPAHTNARGLALVKEFEGFPNNGRPYNDPVGHCTVGYGHLIHFGPCWATDFNGVWLLGQKTPGQLTRAEADRLLRIKLATVYEPPVRALRLGASNRFSATVSIAFNVGPGILARGRSLGDALRARRWRRAADAFLLYRFAGGRVLPGLVRRREAERRLFLTPDPIAFTRVERRLMKAKLTPRTRAALRAQARRVQLAARKVRGGWQLNDRKRRFPALRARALAR